MNDLVPPPPGPARPTIRDIVLGIYNVRDGNVGVARALKESGRASAVVFIGHNLTLLTRALLLDGTISIVVHQDQERELAIQALIDRQNGLTPAIERLPVEKILVKENIMGAPPATAPCPAVRRSPEVPAALMGSRLERRGSLDLRLATPLMLDRRLR